jgi:hypothetical protein
MHSLQFYADIFHIYRAKAMLQMGFCFIGDPRAFVSRFPFHYNSAHHILLISAHSTKFYKTSQSRETVSYVKTHMYLFGL